MQKLSYIYSKTLKLQNDENFDIEFHEILQTLYTLGFYKSTSSKKRIFYGVSNFIFMLLFYNLGTYKDIIKSIVNDELGQMLLNGVAASLTSTLTTEVLTDIFNQNKLIDLIKEFHEVHEKEDELLAQTYKTKYNQLARPYRNFFAICEVIVIILRLIGFHTFTLFIPVLYDEFAYYSFYYPLLALNALNFHVVLQLFRSNDLLHVLCLMKVEEKIKLLGDHLGKCTNSNDLLENEQYLIKCIELHIKTLRKFNKLQKVFKLNFVMKVHGMIIELALLFFILIQISFQDEPSTYVFSFMCLQMTMFQFGTLCYFGQRITSRFSDLLDISYGCNWIDQSKQFKTNLRIFRTICLKQKKIIAGKFEFSHESFYETISNSYIYYTNLSGAVNGFKKRS